MNARACHAAQLRGLRSEHCCCFRCRNNMDDVRELADVAVERNTAIDFHINEAPMVEQDHFEHYDTRVHQAAPLTRNYILGFCYNTRRVVWWGTKQALRGFKGVSGSF